MNKAVKKRCERCGKRLKRGGDNYRFECSVISDFDGYIDAAAGQTDIKEFAKEIEESGLTEQELQEQVYFKREFIFCIDCRNAVVDIIKRLNQK